MSRSSVPPQVPYTDASLRSIGSPGVSSPTSSLLLRRYDFSPPLGPHFVAFASEPTTDSSALRSRCSDGQTPGLDYFFPGARAGSSPRWRRPRPPRFLDKPQCAHAPLFDPAGPVAPGLYRTTDTAFRSGNHVGSGCCSLSRLFHAARTPPVYASQPRSPSDHATLGSGWWPTFAG